MQRRTHIVGGGGCLPLLTLIQRTNPCSFSPPRGSRLLTRSKSTTPTCARTFPLSPVQHHRMTCGLHWLPRRCVVSSLWTKFLGVWPTTNSSGGVSTTLFFFCPADLISDPCSR